MSSYVELHHVQSRIANNFATWKQLKSSSVLDLADGHCCPIQGQPAQPNSASAPKKSERSRDSPGLSHSCSLHENQATQGRQQRAPKLKPVSEVFITHPIGLRCMTTRCSDSDEQTGSQLPTCNVRQL